MDPIKKPTQINNPRKTSMSSNRNNKTRQQAAPSFRSALSLSLLLALFAIQPTHAQNKVAAPAPKATFAAEVFNKAVQNAKKKCVKIYGGKVAKEHGYATGIIVSNDGLIFTAMGIYLASDQLRIVLNDGTVHLAKVLRTDDDLLLGVLKIEAKTPDFFDLKKETIVEQGDWVLAISNPFKVAEGAEALSVTLGVISMRVSMDAKRKRQDLTYRGDALVIDSITSNPGSAGGALVTADGRLAGMLGKIAESKSTNTRMNYAVPADLLLKFMTPESETDTEKAGDEGEPYLGIRLFTMSGKRAPAYIDKVLKDSPAKTAGLKKDDMILAVGSETVRNVREYQAAEKKLRPGQEVAYTVKRGNAILQTKLKVAAKPKSD